MEMLLQCFSHVRFQPLKRPRNNWLTTALHRFALALVFAALPSASFADISIVGDASDTTGAVITGTITSRDAIRIVELEKRGARLKLVRLNSNGGDANAAMTIGRILRKNGGIVLVAEDDVCASACVLILAAGVVRSIHGQILIHRPYSMATDTAGKDLAEWDRRMKAFRKQVDTYLSDMNIAVGLADAMWAISPENSRSLTSAERQQYLMGNADSSYDDFTTTQDAKKYGLTKQEILRRYTFVSERCGVFATEPITKEKIRDYGQCKDFIMRQR